MTLCERYRLQGVSRNGVDGMDVDVMGGKFNMTDVAARIGLGQLPHLDAFTQKRRDLARHYFDCFDVEFGVELPVMDFENSNWHMFQIVLPRDVKRADFMTAMKERGIGTGVHYPVIHLFTLYRQRGFGEGMFPQAERIGAGIVTLPLFPAMTQADVQRVCAAVTESLNALRRA